MTQLNTKVALVTGGTAGIGLEIARTLLAAGATVVVNGRNEGRGLAALQALASERAFLEVGNCADAEEARAVLHRVNAAHGGPHILVVSGGAGDSGPALFSELADDAFSSVYASQFLNRVFPIKAALPFMKVLGGCIVIVGTDAGRHSTVGEALHGSLGAAKIMLTKTLAREFSRWNIRVNGLALTITSGTEAFEQAMGRQDWATDLFKKALQKFPQGRPPQAEEVARVALFLASEQSAQVSGQTISVNGGLSFAGW